MTTCKTDRFDLEAVDEMDAPACLRWLGEHAGGMNYFRQRADTWSHEVAAFAAHEGRSAEDWEADATDELRGAVIDRMIDLMRPTLAEQEARSLAIDYLKRNAPDAAVAYWIEKSFGAFTGELVCRSCATRRDRLGLDEGVENVESLTWGDACFLGNAEGQAPLCDRCGKDIRE